MRNQIPSWVTALNIRQVVYFVYMAITLIVFTFIVPPFQKPDEPTHFQSAVSITNLDLLCTMDADGGFYFPLKRKWVDLPDLMEVWNVWDLNPPAGKKFDPAWLRYDFSDPKYNETVRIYGPCNAPVVGKFSNAHGPVVGYLPNSLGILVGKPFVSPLVSFFLGRLFGGLFFVAALIIALRITPKQYRMPLYFYAALPTVLHQVTSISYDVVQLSLFPVIYAYVTRFLVCDEPIKRRTLISFIVVVLWMISSRIISYFPLVFLIFAIRPSNISSNLRRYAGITAGFFAFALIATAIFSVTYLPRVGYQIESDTGIDASGQVRYVMSHPTSFLSVSYETVIDKGESLVKQGIGAFGWGDTGLRYYSYYAFLIIGAVVIYRLMENDVRLLNWWQIAVLLGSVVLIILLLFFSLYTVASPVGGNVVEGLQGRYFVGLFPFAVFGLSQLAARMGRRLFLNVAIVCFALILLHNIYWAVHVRFYG